MDLSRITIELEELTNNEAIQHGFNVGRVYYKPLIIAQFVAMLPVVVILMLLYFFVPSLHQLSFVIIAVWWFQPYYERVMVLVLSRLVFGEPHTLLLCTQQLIPALRFGGLARLSFLRLGFVRSFHAPIALLEQLKGKKKRQRFTLLNTRAHGSALLMTFSFFLLALIIGINVMTLFVWFVPETYMDALKHSLFIDELLDKVFGLLFLPVVLGNLVLMPFFVSAGFLLYLHQRVSLEGWDIEIKFREIAKRLAKKNTVKASASNSHHSRGIVGLLLLVAMSVLSPQPTLAAENNTESVTINSQVSPAFVKEEAINGITHTISNTNSNVIAKQNRQRINRIARDPANFPYEVKKKWVYVGKKKEKKEKKEKKRKPKLLKFDSTAVAFVFKWAVITLFVIGVIFLLLRYGGQLQWLFPQTTIEDDTAPKVLFGLDMRKTALPNDILAAIRDEIDQQKYRKALSLLYRASLIDLIHQDKLKIKESYTEGDCTALVTQSCAAPKSDFFKRLTSTWLNTAYANQTPEKSLLVAYLDEWSQHFNHTAEEGAS